MKYSRNKTESETTISFDEYNGTARVYTASVPILRKFEKLEKDYPDVVKCVWAESTDKITPRAKKFEMPVRFIKFRGPRQMSDRQKQALEVARAKASAQNQC